MVTLRFDRRRGLRLNATTRWGVAALVVGYALLWGLMGQRLSREEAERAIRAQVAREFSNRWREEMPPDGDAQARVARQAVQRATLDSVTIVRLDLRHSLLDRPLDSRVRFLARVQFAGPVQPAERYYALRISGVGMAPYAMEASRWEWRLRF